MVVGVVSATRVLVRPALAALREWREFRDDWHGVADRPGFPGHLGMPARQLETEKAIEAIRRELTTNGGSTLRDAVRRIEQQQVVNAVHTGAPILSSSPTPAVAIPVQSIEQQHESQGVPA